VGTAGSSCSRNEEANRNFVVSIVAAKYDGAFNHYDSPSIGYLALTRKSYGNVKGIARV
jgi:hypothetical protein